MYEALEDLMKDVIEEKISQAVKLNTEQRDKEMAVKLFGRGMSMDTIAELVGCSADVILQWVSPASQA